MYSDGNYTSAQKNYVLCRKDLDEIRNGNFEVSGYESCNKMQFLRIAGVTNFWKTEENLNVTSLVGDILNSCVRENAPFVYVIKGNKDGIQIYIGALEMLVSSYASAYRTAYPGIDIRKTEGNPLSSCACAYGGMITGLPTNKAGADKRNYQIENICRGMLGRNFTYVVVAAGVHPLAVSHGHERLLEEMEETYSLINRTISGGAQGNIQAQRQDFHSRNYFDNLECLENFVREGISRGMWRVNTYYAADTAGDSLRLQSIIKSAFSGEESRPDPIRAIDFIHINDVITKPLMIAEPAKSQRLHPLGDMDTDRAGITPRLFIYKYQTLMNSDQLAVMCQLPAKEFPGYYVDDYVEFDVSVRSAERLSHPLPIGDITVAGRANAAAVNNKYYLEKNDLTRHALVIGITGGGKTNTCKSILRALWDPENREERVPFLVIESAKREYWELRKVKGFEDLLVYTLGGESNTSVPYRINPFEAMPGISLQTHIDYLLSTFKAAFDLFPPLPYILEQAVYDVYKDRGWDIIENTNKCGLTDYPTLSDLYSKIEEIVDNMGYHQEVQSNVKTALLARVNSLMIGGKGAMLNTQYSIPISELLNRPVVMELEDLGDDETKSFVIGLLLVQLYEYRKSQMTGTSRKLSHLLVVEEAHRLLKNVPEISEGNNTRAKSVEFFCNLLAEIRTYGQGIMISDQIPTKLAPDTIKNTNLKILHRTVAADDRETMGRAMNMDENQINYLSSLERGYAAVYAEGDNKPKCVKLPLVKIDYKGTRADLINESRARAARISHRQMRSPDHAAGCKYCKAKCEYYDRAVRYIDSQINCSLVLEKWKKANYLPGDMEMFLRSPMMKGLDKSGLYKRVCIIGYILSKDKDLSDEMQRSYITRYIQFYNKHAGGK